MRHTHSFLFPVIKMLYKSLQIYLCYFILTLIKCFTCKLRYVHFSHIKFTCHLYEPLHGILLHALTIVLLPLHAVELIVVQCLLLDSVPFPHVIEHEDQLDHLPHILIVFSVTINKQSYLQYIAYTLIKENHFRKFCPKFLECVF